MQDFLKWSSHAMEDNNKFTEYKNWEFSVVKTKCNSTQLNSTQSNSKAASFGET